MYICRVIHKTVKMKRIGKMDNLEVDFVAIDEDDITY